MPGSKASPSGRGAHSSVGGDLQRGLQRGHKGAGEGPGREPLPGARFGALLRAHFRGTTVSV